MSYYYCAEPVKDFLREHSQIGFDNLKHKILYLIIYLDIWCGVCQYIIYICTYIRYRFTTIYYLITNEIYYVHINIQPRDTEALRHYNGILILAII